MGELLLFLLGFCELEISGATPQWALNRLSEHRIAFWKVNWTDAITVRIRILQKDKVKAEQLIQRSMCTCVVKNADGLMNRFRQLLTRPVLLFMIVLSIGVLTWLSYFVLFYDVVGNDTVPEDRIIRALDSLEVDFGTFGPGIKPQTIKDHILNMIPELQWITITQNGCRAQVVVRERPETPVTENRKGFGHVVASRTGIITKQDVYAGQALFEIGDAVLEGEILVSGAVDLERIYLLQKANAEIYALTHYDFETSIPSEIGQKNYSGEEWRCVWLTIGEKRIKIFGNSGISTTNCDKMMETKKLTLPGDLALPVSLTIESFRGYTLQPGAMTEAAAQLLLADYAEEQVRRQMLAGEILSSSHELQSTDGCYTLRTVMECQEMIALPIEADWTKEEFAHDRTNSKRGESGTDH